MILLTALSQPRLGINNWPSSFEVNGEADKREDTAEVAVKVGQEVKAGEKLAVIEAMKMENILKADQDCKVKKISAAAGESLSVDQVIIEFE